MCSKDYPFSPFIRYSGNRALPRRYPHPTGGINEYLVEKPTGLFDAVRQAVAIQETRSGPVPDETIRGRDPGPLIGCERQPTCASRGLQVEVRRRSLAATTSAYNNTLEG